jgi:hypothetical protein
MEVVKIDVQLMGLDIWLLAANYGRDSHAPSRGFIDRAREKQSPESRVLFLPNRNLT